MDGATTCGRGPVIGLPVPPGTRETMNQTPELTSRAGTGRATRLPGLFNEYSPSSPAVVCARVCPHARSPAALRCYPADCRLPFVLFTCMLEVVVLCVVEILTWSKSIWPITNRNVLHYIWQLMLVIGASIEHSSTAWKQRSVIGDEHSDSE